MGDVLLTSTDEVIEFTSVSGASQTDINAAVAAHAGAADPHGDRANAASQISTHAGAADPHGDRADADSKVSTHAGASDPHGDRAYAVAQDAISSAGGSTASDQLLKMWAEAKAYEKTAITYDVTYTEVIASATAKWPDASGGTLIVDTINSTWRKVDAYHITHTASGKTVTQTAVTRNAGGDITIKPALTVA
jgi:hypothetical protein